MAKQEKPATKRWTARLIRKKMEVLGIVYAPDQEAARAAAIAEFKLSAEQAKRLVLDRRQNPGAACPTIGERIARQSGGTISPRERFRSAHTRWPAPLF
jgi:hypothetical protein